MHSVMLVLLFLWGLCAQTWASPLSTGLTFVCNCRSCLRLFLILSVRWWVLLGRSVDSGVNVGEWPVRMAPSGMCLMFLGRLMCGAQRWLLTLLVLRVSSSRGLRLRLKIMTLPCCFGIRSKGVMRVSLWRCLVGQCDEVRSSGLI